MTKKLVTLYLRNLDFTEYQVRKWGRFIEKTLHSLPPRRPKENLRLQSIVR